VSTGKDRTEIQNSNTARTASYGAAEPNSFPTVIATGAIQKNWILLVLPILLVSPVSVVENKAVELGANVNRPDYLAID
jgi:hypothetical protein